MTSQSPRTISQADDVAELDVAMARGRLHRLRPECPEGERCPFPAWLAVPDWVPRTGYALPTRRVLEAVEAGLRKKL
ncbi:hypothetical protein ACFYM2_29365 [Streptomyces sp. NPDC006711]|uniref:hypothetical protein n=1 Tax=unclassified Streptomyces TaxID=2593676 RepID=UPI0033E2406F